MIEVGLQIASVAYGALLGVFLLGVSDAKGEPTGSDGGNAVWVWGGIVSVENARPWTWWVTIGTVVTFSVGYVASLLQLPSVNPSLTYTGTLRSCLN